MDQATHPTIDRGPAPRPPPERRRSVEAEVLLMNRGRGRQVFGLAAGALLLIAAGVVLLQRVTRGDAYAEAAAATARIEQDHFDAFFSCALPGTRPSQLSAQHVHSALENLADRHGKSYAKTLQGCLPQMQALVASVQALQIPRAVKPQHAGLVAAAGTLASANTQLLRYLTDSSKPYDYVAAMLLLEKLGTGWAGYRAAQTDLEQALQERL